MAFTEFQGKWDSEKWSKKASTAFTKNCAVTRTSGADTVEPAVAATTDIIGFCTQTIASTDSDYASNTLIEIRVPRSPNCTFEGDVTGTLATTDVGGKFDLSDSVTIDKAATTTKIAELKKFISTTKGVFALTGYASLNR